MKKVERKSCVRTVQNGKVMESKVRNLPFYYKNCKKIDKREAIAALQRRDSGKSLSKELRIQLIQINVRRK